ncbi:unnamed protein product [Closterium sp. NIES-64]|nr:unnamed protein product [Closterium sp. NIES-64]
MACDGFFFLPRARSVRRFWSRGGFLLAVRPGAYGGSLPAVRPEARGGLLPHCAGCASPERGPYGLRPARARLGPPARGSSGCARPVGGPFLSAPELPAVPRASDGAPPLLLPVLLN